jgi:hypothetical protein
MKVLPFSDIHGDLGALELLVTEETDPFISAGDPSTFGRKLKGSSRALEQQLASRSISLSTSRRTARCSTRSVEAGMLAAAFSASGSSASHRSAATSTNAPGRATALAQPSVSFR